MMHSVFLRPFGQSHAKRVPLIWAACAWFLSLAACEPTGDKALRAQPHPPAAKPPLTAMPAEESPATRTIAEPTHGLVRMAFSESSGLRVVDSRVVEGPHRQESGSAWQRRSWRLQALNPEGKIVYETGFDDPTVVRVPPRHGAADPQERHDASENEPAMVRREGEVQWLVHVPATATALRIFKIRAGQVAQATMRDDGYESVGSVAVDFVAASAKAEAK